MTPALEMEVFEIKKNSLLRQPSVGPPPGNSKMPFLLTIIGIILVTSATMIILHLLLGYSHFKEETRQLRRSIAENLHSPICDDPFCNSKGCVAMASRILELMNPDADPCSDFYEFSCGGYSKSRGLPHAHQTYNPADEARDEILIDIRKLMESSSSRNESRTLKKIKQFYNSCTDTAQRGGKQKQSLLTWFSEIEFSLDGAHRSTWRTLLARLEEYQIHTLLTPTFRGSATLPIEIIEVNCDVSLLEPNVYLDPTNDENALLLSIYHEVMDAAVELLPAMDANRKKEFIDNVLRMETRIARAIQNPDSMEYPLLTAEHLQQIKEFWRPMIGDSIQEVEVVSSCKYNLESIFSTLDNATPKMSAMYIAWKMLLQLLPHLDSEFRDLRQHYSSKLPGWDQVYASTWQECSNLVRKELGLATFKALVDTGHIGAERIQRIKEYFKEVKRNFLLTFRSIDWASALIRRLFLSKVKNMKLNLGYPALINQPEVIDTIYEELEFGDDYFHNVMNLKKFKTRHFFNRLWYGNPKNPISEISLEDNPLGGHSRYIYTKNTVHIDLGLLRPPVSLYLEDIPKYLQFGELSCLARGMSHAFDTTGCFYDGKGKRWERQWWPKTLTEKYDFYTNCLLTQLRNNTSENINSTHTLDTIAADIGSFLVLYDGLTFRLETVKNEKLLPSLSLTRKQTYYIRIAQSYCELRKSSKGGGDVIKSPRFRVNNAVSNMNDFGDVFNCPPHSALNPKVKCNLL